MSVYYRVSEPNILIESVIGFDALYKSMNKCKSGVLWKNSVARFWLDDITEISKLEDELKSGSYKCGPVSRFTVTYPKVREVTGERFRDRIYHRSINDNSLYPNLTKHFIFDNYACQKGKGIDFALNRMKKMLNKAYINLKSNEFYILQIDCRGYYENINHQEGFKLFDKYIPAEVSERAKLVLVENREGTRGFDPGSQMVQLVGIGLPNSVDHFIKDHKSIKYYGRYMDDSFVIHESFDFLNDLKAQIGEEYAKIGCELHPKKTKITKVSDGFRYLGFIFKVTETGKIIMNVDPKKVHDNYKKIRRLISLCKKGEKSRQAVDDSIQCILAHYSKGNSHKLIARTRHFIAQCWRD